MRSVRIADFRNWCRILKIANRTVRHDRVTECGSGKDRSVRGRVAKIRAGEVGKGKINLGEIGICEDRSGEVAAVEISLCQVRISKISRFTNDGGANNVR